MADRRFRVVFSGKVRKGCTVKGGQQKLAEFFGMERSRVEAIFKGRPVVIKKGVDQETAEKFCAAFAKAGAICTVRGNPPRDAGGEAARPGSTDTPPPDASPRRETTAQITGFWWRILALAVDVVLLGIVGNLSGVFFFDGLASMGVCSDSAWPWSASASATAFSLADRP